MFAVHVLTALLLTSQATPPPPPPVAPELRGTNCAVPGERKRLLEQSGAAFEAVQPIVRAANAQMEARMKAHADRLVALGVWKEPDVERFTGELLASADFTAYALKVEAVFSAMLTALETMMAAPQDEEKSCRALLAMLDEVDKSFAIGAEGWGVIDRAYAAEARRLGVSLE